MKKLRAKPQGVKYSRPVTQSRRTRESVCGQDDGRMWQSRWEGIDGEPEGGCRWYRVWGLGALVSDTLASSSARPLSVWECDGCWLLLLWCFFCFRCHTTPPHWACPLWLSAPRGCFRACDVLATLRLRYLAAFPFLYVYIPLKIYV